VPDVVDENLNGLGGTDVEEGHVFMIPLVVSRTFGNARLCRESDVRLRPHLADERS
jgi:hypothetical protein